MKFYLCDDDKSIHEIYREKIENLCVKHKIDCQFLSYHSGEEMLFDLKQQDGFNGVILLDIRMPNIDGITVAKSIQDYGGHGEIIFLTVSKQHFLMAFDVGAFNYIIKDQTSDSRFENVILRAVNAISEKEKDYIFFATAGEHRSVMIDSIRYFEVIKRVVTVHFGKNETFEFFSTLGMLENQLYNRGFVRIHRSFLVRLAEIQTLTYGEVTLHDGTVLPVGRTYYQDVKTNVNEYFHSPNSNGTTKT